MGIRQSGLGRFREVGFGFSVVLGSLGVNTGVMDVEEESSTRKHLLPRTLAAKDARQLVEALFHWSLSNSPPKLLS